MAYLRVFLLSRSGRELFALVDALATIMTGHGTARAAPMTSFVRPPPAGQLGRVWTVRWDGSFSSGRAGVGLTLGYPETPPVLRASVPVVAADATRAEALGPPLAALLL